MSEFRISTQNYSIHEQSLKHDYRELLIYLLFIQSDEYSKQEDFLAGNGWFFKFKVGHGEHFFTAKVTKG